MPTRGFEVRGLIVRQRSARFASVHSVVERRGQQFAAVRHGSPEFVGVAVSVAVKTDPPRPVVVRRIEQVMESAGKAGALILGKSDRRVKQSE